MTRLYPDEALAIAAVDGFLACTLPKADWTHAAHFAVALSLIRAHGEAGAQAAMPALIRAYNDSVGTQNSDTSGYHETITIASIAAAAAFLDVAAPETALHRLVDGLMASELGLSDWPLRYWSRETLFSATARRAWVAPDLRPLPFPVPA